MAKFSDRKYIECGHLFDKPIARMRGHLFDCVTTSTLSPFPTRRTGKGEQEYNQSLPDYQRLLYVQDARKLCILDQQVQKVQELVPLELVRIR